MTEQTEPPDTHPAPRHDDPIVVLDDLAARVANLSDIMRAHGDQLSHVGRQVDGQIAEHGRVAGLLQSILDSTLAMHEDVRRHLADEDDDRDRISALERRVHRLSDGVHMDESEPPPGANGNG